MGYTHYWSFNFKAGKAADLEAKYQQGILECQKFVSKLAAENRAAFGTSGLAGYTAHCRPGSYAGLHVNGAKDDSCEDFIMREHFKQNDASNFCKTRRYYYDTVVQVCLLIMKYRLGDAMTVNSDGDISDWEEAKDLATKAIRRKVTIPDSIRPGNLVPLRRA